MFLDEFNMASTTGIHNFMKAITKVVFDIMEL